MADARRRLTEATARADVDAKEGIARADAEEAKASAAAAKASADASIARAAELEVQIWQLKEQLGLIEAKGD